MMEENGFGERERKGSRGIETPCLDMLWRDEEGSEEYFHFFFNRCNGEGSKILTMCVENSRM